MKLTGEHRIPAPRQKVWDGLNDPEVLGLHPRESLRKRMNELSATVKGSRPVNAKFSAVTLSEQTHRKLYRRRGQRGR